MTSPPKSLPPEYFCNEKGCDFHGQDEEAEKHAHESGHELRRFWGKYVVVLNCEGQRT